MISPRRELSRRNRRTWLRHIPFQFFFDPGIPWPYRFKRQFRKLAKRRSSVITILILALWLVGAWIAFLLSGVAYPQTDLPSWAILYCILLASTWILPVPFFPTAILASLHLGVENGTRLSTTSLWVASFIGYSIARMFPTMAARFYNQIGPSWLPEQMGKRSFQALINVLSDPRIELRTKIAYQGLYCVPLPWFMLSTWLLLPATVYLGCRWVVQLTPPVLIQVIQQNPILFIGGVLGLAAVRAAWRVVRQARLQPLPLVQKNPEGEKSQDGIQKSA